MVNVRKVHTLEALHTCESDSEIYQLLCGAICEAMCKAM